MQPHRLAASVRSLCTMALIYSAASIPLSSQSAGPQSVEELAAYDGIDVPPMHYVNTSHMTPPMPKPASPGACPSECLKHGSCQEVGCVCSQQPWCGTVCNHQCQNGGTCKTPPGLCMCPLGYRGSLCNIITPTGSEQLDANEIPTEPQPMAKIAADGIMHIRTLSAEL